MRLTQGRKHCHPAKGNTGVWCFLDKGETNAQILKNNTEIYRNFIAFYRKIWIKFHVFHFWGCLMFQMRKGLFVYKIFMSTSSVLSIVNFVLEISVYLNFSLYLTQLARDGAECSDIAGWNAVAAWTEVIWDINHSYTQLPWVKTLSEFKMREKFPSCNS